MEGEILGGKYEVLRELGRGGMGAVYEARHTGTGRRVAIKVITADLLKSPGLVQRFEVEARAAGSIESQHIAQVLDTGRDEGHGSPYLVMEYLSGEDLHQLLHRIGPLPVELALRIAAQAALGLDKAHKAKIIHRDVKPANIYLNERDGDEIVVKILDFGVAKIKMEEGQSLGVVLTRTGSLLGSPLYMSPEQARGDKVVDPRSDVWSLGVVLYEALYGRTPYHEIEALGSLIIAICGEPPAPIQSVAQWIPAEVAQIVHKALAIRPEDRFQSAAEMYRAIKPFLVGGHAIDKSMLVRMTAEERAQRPPAVAQTALASSPSEPGLDGGSSSQPGVKGASTSGERVSAPTGSTSSPDARTSTPGGASRPSIPGDGSPALDTPARTTAGVTRDPSVAPAAAPRSKLPIALAIGAVVAAGSFIALRSMGPSAQAGAARDQQPAMVRPAEPDNVVTAKAPAASASAPIVTPADSASAAPPDASGKPNAAPRAPTGAKAPASKGTAAPTTGSTANVGGRIIRTDLP